MPMGARVRRRASQTSLHESREPPGVAWSFPNGSMSTLYTFQSAAHSSRQFSLPFSIDERPLAPHFGHSYTADPPSRASVFAPIFPQDSQKASKGSQPLGYGWRARYLLTTARTSSERETRSLTTACISGFRYASVVVTIRMSG